MSELENNQEIPVVEVPVEPVLEEKTYIYQPTDEDNRPIGGKQVLKYTTQEELADKLRDQNVSLLRKLRQETRKNRLGIVEDETIPEEAQRFGGTLEFNPRELSTDELVDISRRLLDPTTSVQATEELLSARLGAPISDLGSTLKTVQQDNINLRALVEANAFKASNPDYFPCDENVEAITSWILRYDLAPIKSNFQRAYDTLKAQGVMIDGPAPFVPEPPPVPVEVIPVAEVPQEPVQRISTGLTRNSSSSAGTPPAPGSEISYTIGGKVYTGMAALNVMPAEEYKHRLLHDRNFGKMVDKMEAERRKPRV